MKPPIHVMPPRGASAAPAAPSGGNEIFCATLDDCGVAVVRVKGRGTAQNAPALKQLSEALATSGRAYRYVLDLAACETLDSTFLGTLAAIALVQRQVMGSAVVIVNADGSAMRVLRTMGLTHVCEVREPGTTPPCDLGEQDFQPVSQGQISRLEQICLTLQAHKNLVEIDPENHVRFESVIEYLEHSLEREKSKDPRK